MKVLEMSLAGWAILAVAGLASPVHAASPLVCLIQPSRVAEIGTSVTGVIESMRVERGDAVRKGQVVAVLRNDVERAALNVAKSRAQAEADVQAAQVALEFAQQNTARAEGLVRSKFISEQALDKTRTEERVAVQKLAQAREQRRIWEREMNLAQSQLSQRTIVSPISGIVAERYVSHGERVEDRSIARVVSIHPLHVEAMVPAASFGKVKAGMTAVVTPELPDVSPLEARVILVDKLIDGASNTFRVRLELPNPDHALPAGPRCKVAFGADGVAAAGKARELSLKPAAAPATSSASSSRTVAPPAVPAFEAGVLGALENWRQAWAGKDAARYFDAYAAAYTGDHASREEWVRLRKARVQQPGQREIRISDVSVSRLANNQARIQFRQQYRSDHYRDSVRKTLRMALENGKWLIVEERAMP